VLEFYGRAIVNAQRFVYIENQYFTCEFLIELLAKRLQANKDLSIVVLLPKKSEISVPDEVQYQQFRAWISRRFASEPIVAARAVQRLRGIDSNRVFFASPIKAAREDFYVHAKVMVVDDLFATIGSANFSQRSMFIDFELGVAWTSSDGKSTRGLRETLERASWYRRPAGFLQQQDIDRCVLEGSCVGR
jgi:phospholipase D1/2